MAKKILAFMNHERYQVIATFVCILLLVWGLSCESKVRSLADPTQKITRDELNVEVDTFLAQAGIRYKQLDRLDQLKALVFDKLLLWSQGGGFNPIGIVPLIIGILGGSAAIDNVRKRRDIKKLNNAGTSN